ncbi:nitrate- and nitrite sensing domain-containing protein [Nonomuraea africana]|uniref:histidine kinase n=1 Tax=Nonomuraea africana TaxID=46171 RepID=A0ABR9KWJ2_9ACTN|nr:nitrate- and nitrite sensing domain-containing protein [Nonomuraea africana]MBE1566384.1 signal transduction histidine kinase [Nonomuraea africana]
MPEPGEDAGSKIALRNWRVRTRLVALIAVPTLVAVLLGALRVTTSISSAEEYGRVADGAELVVALGALGHELALERDLSARYAAANRSGDDIQALKSQYQAVDGAVTKVRSAVRAAEESMSELGRRQLAQVRVRLDQLPLLRATVSGDDSQLPPLPVMEKYSEVISDLHPLYDETVQGISDDELVVTNTALGAVARTKDEVSKQRALLTIALVRGRFDGTEFDAFLSARSSRESERNAFRAAATPTQRQFFDDTVTGQEIGRAELYVARAIYLHNQRTSLRALDTSTTQDAERWFEAITKTADRLYTVEKSLSGSISMKAAELRAAEQQVAIINVVLVLVLLVIVLIITAIMARSLVLPLRRLRGDALDVAGRTLPGIVQRLREEGHTAENVEVPPIGVSSKDEIGEVARAFDEVHREAVRLAGEESKLRANVNAMFVNLSRRSQTLVERQITLIDGLEQGEQDEQRLANLFKLDHLATRMRRNSENLLVLAGQDPPRRWSQPVQLVDVARASLSEVENYDRVTLQVPGGAAVAGQAVNDVIHLLAELVENALAFSPRETHVIVSGNRIDGGGVMVSITDSGIGMTQEEIVQANERLAVAPSVDVSVSRRMGLFVVARLAHRHGIRVQLRPHGSGGLTAMVLLPESLLGGAPTPAMAGSGMAGSGIAGMAGSGMAGSGMAGPGAMPGLRGGAAQSPMGWDSEPQRPAPFTADTGPAWASDPGPMGGPGGWPSESGPAPGWAGADTAAGGSWPSAPQWPSDPGAWSSGPRQAPSTFDSGEADVWAPSKGGAGWQDTAPPDPAASWSFQDRTPAVERPGRYDFPSVESNPTGPIPAVKPTGDEFLPIFASVESAWFDKGDESASWGSSRADAGWSAAEAVREPVKDGSTAAGLPKRVPKANLVPGSADTSAPKGVAPMPEISPERVRNRFSSFQQGLRAARDDIGEGRYQGGPRTVDNREEDE